MTPASPRVVLALDAAIVETSTSRVELSPGEALFVAVDDGAASVTSDGVAFVGLPGGGRLRPAR